MIRTCLFKLSTRIRRSESWRRRELAAIGIALAGFAVLAWPLGPRATSPVFSRTVVDHEGALLRAYLSSDEKWRFAVDSAGLPRHVTEGLICLEDHRFRWHPGVDPLAIGRALGQNISSGRVVSGASTLTMQVARLIDPRPRRLLAKIAEAVDSFRLEAHFSKKQILDLYLTYAPFGTNIEGIEAASERYFLKSARYLSPSETAFLFLLPQSPKRWDTRAKVDLKRLRDRNLARFAECGLINASERERFSAEAIPDWRGSFPVAAPHFADWVGESVKDVRLAARVDTTLDRALQRSIEELVDAREARLRELGIVNVGLLAVDNASGEIRAAIGNFSYERVDDAQKITSFLVNRSPGSLLKSFLYGHLLESGEILPETLLEDVPVDIKGYEPKNYNGEFQGLVEARMALAHSLNVPWVKALRDHGVEAFLDFLLKSGLKTPQKPAEIGLSMAIGGMETNLKDLVMLYRALADHGRMRPLAARPGDVQKPWQWMNDGAAQLVREALKIRGRPDFALDPQYLASPTVRWKTGTSQGNHDAWAIGFDPEWTVGVWLGNLDNRPSPSLVGPEVAAPLMFDAFARIRQQTPRLARDWIVGGVEPVEVCAFSGLPAGPSCPHRKATSGIRGLAMHKRCPYHHDILVDEKSGMRITKECESAKMRPAVKAALDLSPDLSDWARRNLSGAELSPPFHPACDTRPTGKGRLAILMPEATSYFLHSGLTKLRKRAQAPVMEMPLRVKSATPASSLHCFLNGRPLARAALAAATPHFLVPPGDHTLLCADDQGRADQVSFSVER